jgi:hypothetical protein
VKRRENPQAVNLINRVDPRSDYLDAPPREAQPARVQQDVQKARNGAAQQQSPEGVDPQVATPIVSRQVVAEPRTVDAVTDEVIKAGLTDSAIGAGLREVSQSARAVEDALAYSAIIAKALVSRERNKRRAADS